MNHEKKTCRIYSIKRKKLIKETGLLPTTIKTLKKGNFQNILKNKSSFLCLTTVENQTLELIFQKNLYYFPQWTVVIYSTEMDSRLKFTQFNIKFLKGLGRCHSPSLTDGTTKGHSCEHLIPISKLKFRNYNSENFEYQAQIQVLCIKVIFQTSNRIWDPMKRSIWLKSQFYLLQANCDIP